MQLFIILLTIPLIEIGLFVLIGGEIGLWPTLAIVIATAITGAVAIRSQGKSVIRDFNNLSDPTAASQAMLSGVFIVVAGLLLLTPGFLTDVIGLTLLFPPARALLVSRATAKIKVAAASAMEAQRARAAAQAQAQPAAANPRPRPEGEPYRPANDQRRPHATDTAEQNDENGTDAPRKPTGRPMPDADDAVIIEPADDKTR